eukprot:1306724-Amphidinium_carterae.1
MNVRDGASVPTTSTVQDATGNAPFPAQCENKWPTRALLRPKARKRVSFEVLAIGTCWGHYMSSFRVEIVRVHSLRLVFLGLCRYDIGLSDAFCSFGNSEGC